MEGGTSMSRKIDDIMLISNYKDRIRCVWDKRELLGIKDEIRKSKELSAHWKDELLHAAQHKIDYMEV